MKYLSLIFLLIVTISVTKAQPTAGITGLLNIPTAEMQRDGTFMFGGNYLPESITPETFSYNTGNYYINITFLSFFEVNYRMTLLQTKRDGSYNNQDRSFAVRCQLLKERKFIPAIVIGGNDIYTSTVSGGNQYFGAVYMVATKNAEFNKVFTLSATLGYGLDSFERNQYEGFFGGIALVPGFFKPLTLMAEYDTKVINAGASIFFFNHLHIYAFAYDLKFFCGGVQYKVYMKK